MGAYENPPLITQPNYGEIFSRNAQNIMAIVRQRKEEQERKNKEKEQKFLAASERKTDFSRRASNIKAGALTENVTQIGFDLTDKYYQNEDLFAKGEIDAEQYSLNKAQYESVLSGISSTGTAIRQFEETIKDLDLSSYQPNAEVFGLIEAYKQGKVDAEIVDGQIELKYEDPQGNIQSVDGSWLNSVKSWSVVEKFDDVTTANGLAKIVEDQLTQQISIVEDTDTSRITTTEQRYSEAYGTREQRLNQLMQNPIIQGLDEEDLGSYYMDRIVPNMSSDVASELNNILNSENYKDLSNDQKKQIIEDVNNGVWSNRDLDVNGKTVNSSSVLMELSKRQFAKQVLSIVREPKVSKQIVVNATTNEFEKELSRYTNISQSNQLENLRVLRQTITDNNYGYEAKDGIGTITQVDEEGNKVVIEQINLKDPYEVSKSLVKFKYGKDTKESRKLVDAITRIQVNQPSQTTSQNQPSGFEQGLSIDQISFTIDNESHTLNTSTENSMSAEEASKKLGINMVIPKGLQDKGIPVTKENIELIKSIMKKTGKKASVVLSSIPNAELLNKEVVLTPKSAKPNLPER